MRWASDTRFALCGLGMDEERYRNRYPFMVARRGVWQEIVRAVARDAPGAKAVVELGAGYCDFINQFPAREKWAFDVNPDMAEHAASDVKFRVGSAVEMAGIDRGSVDLVFASNLLEHLSWEAAESAIRRAKEVLRPGGRIALIQPNFRLCPRTYFVDDTHVTIFTDESLAQLLVDQGLKIERIEPGWLPFSMKSRAPKWPLLVRLYLASPFKPNAAQMYLVARKD